VILSFGLSESLRPNFGLSESLNPKLINSPVDFACTR